MDLESGRIGYFRDEHLHLLTLLSAQIAISVENARLYEELAQREQRMEQDLKAARKVQSVLLPVTRPKVQGPGDGHRDAPGARDQRRPVRLLRARHADPRSSRSAIRAARARRRRCTERWSADCCARSGSGGGIPSELLRLLNDVLLERKVDAHYVTLLLLDWDADKKHTAHGERGLDAADHLPGRRALQTAARGRAARAARRSRVRRGGVRGAQRRHRSCCTPTASTTR